MDTFMVHDLWSTAQVSGFTIDYLALGFKHRNWLQGDGSRDFGDLRALAECGVCLHQLPVCLFIFLCIQCENSRS